MVKSCCKTQILLVYKDYARDATAIRDNGADEKAGTWDPTPRRSVVPPARINQAGT